MDQNNDHGSIMEDIIASGSNQVRTYTDEERSQADGFLNIPVVEEANTTANEGNTTPAEDDDTHAEDDNAQVSIEVYISCIKFIIINNVTPNLT